MTTILLILVSHMRKSFKDIKQMESDRTVRKPPYQIYHFIVHLLITNETSLFHRPSIYLMKVSEKVALGLLILFFKFQKSNINFPIIHTQYTYSFGYLFCIMLKEVVWCLQTVRHLSEGNLLISKGVFLESVGCEKQIHNQSYFAR